LKSEAIAKQGEVKVIVGLSGKKGSGKSTVAGYLERRIEGAVRLPFAFRLKEIARDCFGARSCQVDGTQEEKHTMLACGLTGREVMQRIGQDMRAIWPACWVYAWEAQVVSMWAEWGVPMPIIVEDVRFENEVQKIKRMGGIVIRLTREPFRDGHESESGLDLYGEFDAILENEGMGVDETCAAALSICREHGVV
jgi:hypothetical protein